MPEVTSHKVIDRALAWRAQDGRDQASIRTLQKQAEYTTRWQGLLQQKQGLHHTFIHPSEPRGWAGKQERGPSQGPRPPELEAKLCKELNNL